MINDALITESKSHHPILVSYFASPDEAELAIADLMDEGLSSQDFVLLKLGEQETGRTDPLEYVVAPFAGSESRISDDTEDSAERESEVGGGIATTSPNDDVSALQEMDDSETVAEDQMYPSENHSIGDEQTRDVARAANEGAFDTTRPAWGHKRAAAH